MQFNGMQGFQGNQNQQGMYGYGCYVPDRQNFQQFQSQVQTQMSLPNQQQPFYGKVVDNFDSITANDVPMNGQPATFIKNDGSEIQVRVWTPSGTIATTRYKPYTETKAEETANTSPDSLESLYDDFKSFREELLGRIDRLDKSVSGKSNSGRGSKREVESDE